MLMLMVQLWALTCMIPVLILSQDLLHLQQRKQAETVSHLLLAQQNALQQYCSAIPCGDTPHAVAPALLAPYLAPALAQSPFFAQDVIKAAWDGQHALSYIDPTRLATLKGARLLGQVQAQWSMLQIRQSCAGIYDQGQDLVCGNGTRLALPAAPGLGIPQDALVIVAR